MTSFQELLEGSVQAHGHLCPGQVVGVRMAILGLRLLGFDAPPTLPQLKQLIVYVEMDRCTGDAVAHVTNVKLGRRSLKFMDYGIMAATFVNLATSQAFRIISTEVSRDLAMVYAPAGLSKREAQLHSYRIMPDAVMFRVQEVKVDLSEFDLPGPTRRKVSCAACGQVVRDQREIVQHGQTLCRPCALGAYFSSPRDIAWPEMNWSPCSPEDPKEIESFKPRVAAGEHWRNK
jgi:formylmethanofuran dehydrogenase subunit E